MSDPNGVVVIGGGLLGLASAWALNEQGYTVSVLDARDELAAATSYANAGMLTPSMADPWNSPGIWRSLLRYVGREQGPIVLRPARLAGIFFLGAAFFASFCSGPSPSGDPGQSQSGHAQPAPVSAPA